jgi:BCD family chlorophyll transporter-like MFS transporter
MNPVTAGLGWGGIFRAALVQTALGAVVVLTTSTMNRIMVVELALPAMLPGALVALHYVVQMLRPRMGHGSDKGGRRTPWIVGGMAVLSVGGVLAAVATALMASSLSAGIALATLAFLMIGAGVGAAGTSLLALVARQVEPQRRAPAATAMWTMMIFGFALTAGVSGQFLDPYTPARLVLVTSVVAAFAFLLACIAIRGVERSVPGTTGAQEEARAATAPFWQALGEVWREPQARRFTLFVLVSMLAYSAQDLILEPFAGLVFGFSPGQSTQLSGLQNGGTLVGMLLVAAAAGSARGRRLLSLRAWTVVGCLGSALALASLALSAQSGVEASLRGSVLALGIANGAFAIAAVASMMELAHAGRARREGTRIGLWGAAQAIAYATGGFAGAAGLDFARNALGVTSTAFQTVFALEALLFVLAAGFALRVGAQDSSTFAAVAPIAPRSAG